MRRGYVWLYLLIPLMAFTRPGVLAFALFLGLFGIWRWFSRRREPLAAARDRPHRRARRAGRRHRVRVAGHRRHRSPATPGAYLATELAWRRNWIGDTGAGFLPFDGFVQGAGFWFGSLGARLR